MASDEIENKIIYMITGAGIALGSYFVYKYYQGKTTTASLSSMDGISNSNYWNKLSEIEQETANLKRQYELATHQLRMAKLEQETSSLKEQLKSFNGDFQHNQEIEKPPTIQMMVDSRENKLRQMAFGML